MMPGKSSISAAVVAALAAFCAVASFADSASAARAYNGKYSGDKVYRFDITSDDQVALVNKMVKDHRLDLWSHGAHLGKVDVRVPASALPLVKEPLLNKIPNEMIIANVQDLVEKEYAHSTNHSRKLDAMIGQTDLVNAAVTASTVFSDYQSLATLSSFLASLPGAKQVSIGTTYLGADIPGFQFGTGPKKFVIDGGIHAREWIAPASVTYIANWLATTTSQTQKYLDAFTFTIIPVANPDGYAFTRASNGDRLFRKNRQPNSGSSCVGTDPNRNFDNHWSQPGASNDPCDDAYYGPSAFSTPEAKAIATYVKNQGAIGYIDFHSYSELWMFPNGYSCSAKVADYTKLLAASQKAVAALKAVNGQSFAAGDICNTIYQASGDSVDYTYNNLGVTWSFAVELRGTSSDPNGFVLPASQIVPAGNEVVAAMDALLTYILGSTGSTTTTSTSKATTTTTSTKTTTTSTPTGTACAHSICSTGVALKSACDPCAAKVIAADSFCGSSSWDSTCVSEVKSVCGQTC
ncbi:hypothetical protein DFJ73DRAFT_914527 [Zopfochytrium polystomum]|nr:hypothetical protein DFJ73DRAFT_914527 [Zopfochytrium polystomum]